MKRALGAFMAGCVLLVAPHARGEANSCPQIEWSEIDSVSIQATHTVRRGENLFLIA
ncbi:MAG: hypothetical protein HYT27_03970, partial [Parcubacteria group bacterium]|nr:hypothetical protein [Parcubacteria group bacterium]